MSSKTQDYLDPAYLASLQNIKFMARIAVEGYLAGLHRSLFQGSGTEFVQYRNYTPGEDLKYLDWKLLAKTDRLYSKVFQEETNMACHVILDASASMNYKGSRASVNKFKYACMTAACIGYLASRQGDNIGLYAYSDKPRKMIKSGHRSGQLDRFLKTLTVLDAEGSANHEEMIKTFGTTVRGRGIVVLISDMLEAEKVLPDLLKHLKVMHCDCLALQILDPDEIDLPQNQVTRYIDSEHKREMITYPKSINRQYRDSMATFISELKHGFSKSQIDYLQLVSTDSLGVTLARYLEHRERMA